MTPPRPFVWGFWAAAGAAAFAVAAAAVAALVAPRSEARP